MGQPITIHAPELFHIASPGPASHKTFGANQLWYPTVWQRRAGCGPTACSHLLWYLSRTRAACSALCTRDASFRPGFTGLMEEVWHYVTPGRMGVNNTSILAEGAVAYGDKHGVTLQCRVLDVPVLPVNRPSQEQLFTFLATALRDDLPVAFLNLSNGALKNLDNWHWVTLIAFDPQTAVAVMADQGVKSEIDLGLWLKTTTLGGGFVAVEPFSEASPQ